MQIRAYPEHCPVTFASFESVFRQDTSRLIWEFNQPLRDQVNYLHHHDAIEVGYCLSGSGVFFIDGHQLPFHAPCASVIYPGQVHIAISKGDTESRWLFVTFQAEGVFAAERLGNTDLPWSSAQPQSCLCTQPSIVSLAAEIAEEYQQKEAGCDECIRGLLGALLIRHSRLPRRKTVVDCLRQSSLRQLQPLFEYISIHYSEEMTIEQLAAMAFVHPTTLRSWFHAAVGMTPMQYIHRTRIAVACSLLRGTDRPILDIALEVGYGSMSGFNRHFREICGYTPTSYRRPVHS